MTSLFSIICLEIQLNMYSVCDYTSKTISQGVVRSSAFAYSFCICLVLVQDVSDAKSNTILTSIYFFHLSLQSQEKNNSVLF